MMLSPGLPSINPLVPSDWKWVGLRRQPYHGRSMTYFAARHGEHFHIYANADVETAHHKEVYDEDVSIHVHAYSASAAVVALRRPGELTVLIGNVGAQTAVVPVNLEDVVDPAATYDTRIYNSERGDWETGRRATGAAVVSLAVSIESKGYRIIELKTASA